MRSGGRAVRFRRKGRRQDGFTLALSSRLGLGKDDDNGLAWWEGTGLGNDEESGLSRWDEVQGLMPVDGPPMADSGGGGGGLQPFR